MGLRDPEVMAEFQGAKVCWRWSNYLGEPCTKLWHIKYARDKAKDQLFRLNDDQPGSPIWQKEVSGRCLVQDHYFWEIRNGENANFWEDS